MEIKRFYTVIVLSIDMFESSIVDERHFGDADEARRFSSSLPSHLKAVICEV